MRFFSLLARRTSMSRVTIAVGAASLIVVVAGTTGLAQPGKPRGGGAPHPAPPAPHAAPPPAPHFAAPVPHAAPPPSPHFAAPAPRAAPAAATPLRRPGTSCCTAARTPLRYPGSSCCTAAATAFRCPGFPSCISRRTATGPPSSLQGRPHRPYLELRTLRRLGQHLASHHLVRNHILQAQTQASSSPGRA